jgi:hypothetical protein
MKKASFLVLLGRKSVDKFVGTLRLKKLCSIVHKLEFEKFFSPSLPTKPLAVSERADKFVGAPGDRQQIGEICPKTGLKYLNYTYQ